MIVWEVLRSKLYWVFPLLYVRLANRPIAKYVQEIAENRWNSEINDWSRRLRYSPDAIQIGLELYRDEIARLERLEDKLASQHTFTIPLVTFAITLTGLALTISGWLGFGATIMCAYALVQLYAAFHMIRAGAASFPRYQIVPGSLRSALASTNKVNARIVAEKILSTELNSTRAISLSNNIWGVEASLRRASASLGLAAMMLLVEFFSIPLIEDVLPPMFKLVRDTLTI